MPQPCRLARNHCRASSFSGGQLVTSAASSKFGVNQVIEQIGIARQHHTKGFVLFNYGVLGSRELLPKLRLGITAKE